MTAGVVRRDGGLPLYRQLIERLESRIAGGAWQPDERLPSESALATAFGVHRLTVRQALADLAHRGVIRTVRGKGSFVAPPVIRYEVAPGHAASFTRAMAQAGRTVRLRPLSSGAEADPEVAVELATEGPVHRYDTLRLVDETPWSVSSTWLASTRFPGLARHWHGEVSLYDVLAEHYGVRMTRRSRTFAAERAGPGAAEHLGVAPGAPLLLVRGVNVDASGVPVAVVTHRFRSDRVQFTVTLE